MFDVLKDEPPYLVISDTVARIIDYNDGSLPSEIANGFKAWFDSFINQEKKYQAACRDAMTTASAGCSIREMERPVCERVLRYFHVVTNSGNQRVVTCYVLYITLEDTERMCVKIRYANGGVQEELVSLIQKSVEWQLPS